MAPTRYMIYYIIYILFISMLIHGVSLEDVFISTLVLIDTNEGVINEILIIMDIEQ